MPVSPTPRPLDLKRHLLTRVSLFAMVVLLLGSLFALLEVRYRVRADIQRTGHTIRQLLEYKIDPNSNPFERRPGDVELSLAPLEPLGELAHFCIRMTDIAAHPIAAHCFPGDSHVPPFLEEMMAAIIGTEAQYQSSVGPSPGVLVGQITVSPDYGSEFLALEGKLAGLLLVTALILLMNLLIYRPVRKALEPADAILDTLTEMKKGNLLVRVPQLPLIEFARIGQGFNHLADRLQRTIQSQQQLAHRLLSVREEERQYLARELHDEFGQCLAAINAEAAYAKELAEESVPALRPCAESIAMTTQHMMEALHRILHRLRPVGLEEFGLVASLEQLVSDWNLRCRGKTTFALTIEGKVEGLSDDVNVSIYRIVQESITNAVRHAQSQTVAIHLRQSDDGLSLEIHCEGGNPSAVEVAERDAEPSKGGYGLLGMEERVLALGGVFAVSRDADGMMLRATLPRPGAAEAIS